MIIMHKVEKVMVIPIVLREFGRFGKEKGAIGWLVGYFYGI